MRAAILIAAGALLVAGCGSDGRSGETPDGGTDTGTDTGTADGGGDAGDAGQECEQSDPWCNGCEGEHPFRVRLTGRVMGPGGLFPVPRAVVAAFADQADIDPVPDGAYCEQCLDLTGVPAVQSAPDGTFCLDVEPGAAYGLMVQKGQFRRVRDFTAGAAAGEEIALDQDLVTLPSTRDDALGDTIPNIAVVIGDYDAIEDVLGKAGIGAVDNSYKWIPGSQDGEVRYDVYDNRTVSFPDPTYGPKARKLVEDLATLMQYHMVFFACSASSNFDFMADPAIRQNLRDYTWAGGKVYVSDYAYYVADLAWDDFLGFVNPYTEPQESCDDGDAQASCNHGPAFNSPGTVEDDDLREWLSLVMEDNGDSIDDLVLNENWNTIGGLGEGVVGHDVDTQADIVRGPKVWVQGPWRYPDDDWPFEGFDDDAPHPLTVSWPYNCGRTVYTTYHTVGTTAGGGHKGLIEQEMILYYLVMEIGMCQADVPVVVE
jgi:hypothetical protein